MGVGGCETKTIGYACRSVALKVFGREFDSRHLHHHGPWRHVAARGLLLWKARRLLFQEFPDLGGVLGNHLGGSREHQVSIAG